MSPTEKLQELLPEHKKALRKSVSSFIYGCPILCESIADRDEALRILKDMGFLLDNYSNNIINGAKNAEYNHPYIHSDSHVACCRSSHSQMKVAIPYDEFIAAVCGEVRCVPLTDEEFDTVFAMMFS